MVGVKYVASVSFGKDSLAMLLRLLEEKRPLDAVIFYDTGMEFQAIYKIRSVVQQLLNDAQIELITLHNEMPFEWYMLHKVVKQKDGGTHCGYGWCGGTCRWGTELKTGVIQRYKRSLNDTVIDYVGIAADEVLRIEKEQRKDKVLPLVEWGMTEADCLQYCRDRGFNWIEDGVDLYDILDRVSCWCCTNKNLRELRNIYHLLPNYWMKLMELQDRISFPFKQSGIERTIYDFEKRFELEDRYLKDGKPLRTKEFFTELKEVLKVG